MSASQTPLTDALFTGDMDPETISHMVTLSRRLERDRTALIAALTGVMTWYGQLDEPGLVPSSVELSARLRDARATLARMVQP